MSSSDDDWMPQMRPASQSAGTGQSAMMDARRRALQQQREAQQQQQQQQEQQRRPPTAGRRENVNAPAAPAPAKKFESDLPDFLTGLDDGDDGAVVPATLHSPSQATQIFPAVGTSLSNTAAASPSFAAARTSPPPAMAHGPTVEELERQIAAKRKLLQSTKEREAALVEKWRVTKAQKQAEVEQLNGRIRRVWGTIEDEKSASETKIREAQDRHEAELRAARRSVEQAVKADYEAKLAAAQAQLGDARAEEARLRALLEDKGGSASAKDTVNTALSAAITAVMHKLDAVFESEGSDGLRMESWKAELQTMVQREIQTSFAVGVESETQAERDEYERFFSDMLAFWRAAEDQERERLLKMDESLLTDLQAMAQQDLKRLQDEELAMERVYVESREAWAMEHQRLLQHELKAALQRREGEVQEQRRMRHDLHVERLRDADARHKECMAREEALHHKSMEQLRAYFSREESLREQQLRVEAAAQESVAESANVLRAAMTATEETAAALKTYEQAVEESRRGVETEREQYFHEQADLLEKLQALAAAQCGHTDAERRALEECAAQLRVTSQVMERHLQDEAAWMTQQEATHKRSKEEWEREYRRWQHLVEQERQTAEERFHEALTGVQQSVELLAEEERDVALERATLQRTFAEVEAAAQREVEALQRRAADVQSRSVVVAELQARVAQQKSATAEARRELTVAQQQLEAERDDLRVDEERLRDMVEALRVARSRATLRDNNHHQSVQLLQNAEVHQPQQQPQQQRDRPVRGRQEEEVEAEVQHLGEGGGSSRGNVQPPLRKAGAEGPSNTTAAAAAANGRAVKKHRNRSDPNRLPNKILHELSDQLHHLTFDGAHGGREAFVPTMRWTDPAYPAAAHRRATPSSSVEQRKIRRPRESATPPPASELPPPPPPLAASPQSMRRERRTHRPASQQHTPPSPTPQQRQQQQQQQQRGHAVPHARHVDPSSLPPTSGSSPSLSQRGDIEWSPSANTFTNLVDFSDADTTSQSMR